MKDNDKFWISVISIAAALMMIALFALMGADIGNIRIRPKYSVSFGDTAYVRDCGFASAEISREIFEISDIIS